MKFLLFFFPNNFLINLWRYKMFKRASFGMHIQTCVCVRARVWAAKEKTIW